MENTLQLGNLLKEGTYPEEYTGGKNWTILHGDTLKLVKAFQPGIFDAVITDPPYASGGTKQNERNRTTNQKYSSMKAENALPDFDGDNKDQRSWTHWMAEWLYDARKACKVGAPICLFIDWRQYQMCIRDSSRVSIRMFGAGLRSRRVASIIRYCRAARKNRSIICRGITGETTTSMEVCSSRQTVFWENREI